jgi:hypothetical protein
MIKALMVRHRVGIRETLLLAGLLVFAGLVALQFEFGGASDSDMTIDYFLSRLASHRRSGT